MSAILEVKKLTKVYPRRRGETKTFTAVDDVSFHLEAGEILGVLGPNGAGKSTIISMLLGILTPTSGQIQILGKDLATERSAVVQHMTFASTYVRMPWRLTIYENLRVFALLYGIRKPMFHQRAEKFLKYFGVWDERHKIMSELSAGQITRVMLAKAFIPYPKIVLLDEPTASLDPEIAHQVRRFVAEEQKEYGTSILYTSHNMDEITEVCDRVIFLRQGRVIAEDTPANLARSISGNHMVFTVADDADRERLAQFTRQLGYGVKVIEREVEIIIDEEHVAEFLNQIAQAKIHYNNISINQPTLEDYFLTITKQTPTLNV